MATIFDLFRRKERKPEPPPATYTANTTIQLDQLRSAIANRKKADPLVMLRAASREVNQRLINGLTTPEGVHFESFLGALGSLAGYSCQMCARSAGKVGAVMGVKENEASFSVHEGADGRLYYYGDAVTRPLVEDANSIWGFTVGVAQRVGAPVADINEIFAHVSETAGTDLFGLPRITPKHAPKDLPINYLRTIWPKVFPMVKKFSDVPADWPVLFGLAIQDGIFMGKDVLGPTEAAQIVMECAVPMAIVDVPELCS